MQTCSKLAFANYYESLRRLRKKKTKAIVSMRVEIERRFAEDQNLDVTREKSLEVSEAARNANPPASLTSCVSITLNLVLLRRPSSSQQLALILLHCVRAFCFYPLFRLLGEFADQ